MKKLNIGIVGGSIAGCSAAILLVRAGHEVTIFERSTGDLVGRGGGIGTTTAVLQALMEQDIVDSDFPRWAVTEMPFTARRSAADRYGFTPWAMPMEFQAFHWSTLWQNLRRRVPDAVYQQGKQVINAVCQGDDPVTVQLADGAEAAFDLVLFADGYQSLGRQLLFPEVELSYRGYMLWRGLLPEKEMKDSTYLGTKLPRLSYAHLPGHMVIYFIPDQLGSTAAGERIFNWAAYLPVAEEELDTFMVDRHGVARSGTIPPGYVRQDEEDRLKQLIRDNLPGYYGEIVGRTQDTYVQLIYTVALSAYYHQRIALIGDAGMVVQPFTGSGVFKGYNNVKDLLAALSTNETVDQALQRWSEAQVRTGNRLLALGEQMEQAFIWNPLDFAAADEASTAAWWKASVTFPDDFTHEAKRG